MWSFEISYRDTGERDIIFGYSWKDACRRAGIAPNDPNVEFIRQDYED